MTTTKDTAGCKCGPTCNCGPECACMWGQNKKIWIKSGVTLFSAILISASILTCADIMRGSTKMFGFKKFKGDRGEMMSMRDQAFADFIQKNPKVIIDSVDAYMRGNKGKAVANDGDCGPDGEKMPEKPAVASPDIVKSIVNDSTNYSLGNPKGKFVIVEFFDYNCGWCRKTNTEITKALAAGDVKNVRWILLDMPIIGGPRSEILARYVLAAGKQGKYKEMHDAVSATGGVDEAKLVELAKGLNLNVAKLKADADSAAIKNKLAQNMEYAKKLGISGVPFMIVNGKVHPGALFGDNLKAAIEESKKMR